MTGRERWVLVMRKTVTSVLACVALAAMVGCSPDERSGAASGDVARPETSSRLAVQVVNYPLQYFAERIGGERVTVVFPAPREIDPAFWSPDPDTIVAYQRADLVLLNGAGYAKWVQRASLPGSRVVDTSAAFRDRYIPLEQAISHGHGPAGEHSHKGFTFTTWLDPTLAIHQAGSVLAAFVEKRPEREAEFREGFSSLEADLLDLDREWAAWAEAVGDAPLFFSHPVYQYFARRYGLNAVSLHWEADAMPDEAQWRRFEKLRREHAARWMIWEGPPLRAVVQKLRQSGIESVVLEPCGNVPDEGDYLTVMRRGIEALRSVSR